MDELNKNKFVNFLLLILSHTQVFACDSFIIWSFIINPLVHDYDLIQLVLLLDNQIYMNLAIIFSIPG
jgi:hypothetical protein